MGKARLIELIDQAPSIKSKFQTENFTMFSGYDFHTRKRTSGGVDLEMIYKDLDFQQWRDELCIELAPVVVEDERIPEQMLVVKITRALTKLQRNHHCNSS